MRAEVIGGEADILGWPRPPARRVRPASRAACGAAFGWFRGPGNSRCVWLSQSELSRNCQIGSHRPEAGENSICNISLKKALRRRVHGTPVAY